MVRKRGIAMSVESYIIEVRPLAHRSGNTPGRRMAAWLKIGLRSFGLKCIGMQQSPQAGSVPQAPPNPVNLSAKPLAARRTGKESK